jgi:hypothetical protein
MSEDTPTRTGADVEKTVREVLGDLTAGRVNKGSAEQIKSAAEHRIKKATGDEALHRAVGPR